MDIAIIDVTGENKTCYFQACLDLIKQYLPEGSDYIIFQVGGGYEFFRNLGKSVYTVIDKEYGLEIVKKFIEETKVKKIVICSTIKNFFQKARKIGLNKLANDLYQEYFFEKPK